MNYAASVSRKVTPQSEPIPGSNQVENNAGGYAYQLDKWALLKRFLILGSEGGTFYVAEQKLTRDNAKNVEACIKEDGMKTLDILLDISKNRKAYKVNPGIFVLALLLTSGTEEVRKAAAKNITVICVIGTHILTLASYVDELRSWGRLIRNGFASWYNKDPDRLIQQITKYANREGWTHRDLLRSIHTKPTDEIHNTIFKYIVKGYTEDIGKQFPYLSAVEMAKADGTDESCVIEAIKAYDLPREVIATTKLNSVNIWEALLQKMPMVATLRNLGKMTSIKLLGQGKFDANNKVLELLSDKNVKESRVHPMQILIAMKTYASGAGIKGSLTWQPVPQIIDALNAAFYTSFGNIVPSNKKICLALDISGSMGSPLANSVLTCREGSAAMAMITARTEKNYAIMGFGNTFQPLDISPSMRLDDIVEYIDSLGFGGTDCSVPMIWAERNKLQFDAFCVYTDSETWAGNIHPRQALQQYRSRREVPEAKLAVVGMVANEFSIADPLDKNMMDFVGFDASTPQAMSDFIAGNI